MIDRPYANGKKLNENVIMHVIINLKGIREAPVFVGKSYNSIYNYGNKTKGLFNLTSVFTGLLDYGDSLQY